MAEPALKLTETNEVETKALTIVDRAALISVTDAASYTSAGTLWKQIGEMIKEVKETFDPIVKKAHEAHKEATQKRSKYLDPLESAQKSVKRLMSDYDAEQERIRKAEEERLRKIEEDRLAEERRKEQARLEEERKAEEKRLLDEAVAAEERGDNETAAALTEAAVETSEQFKQEAADIAKAPVYVPPVVVPKTVPKIAGGPTYQERWYAEVIDVKSLCFAIGTGKASPEYVMGLDRDKVTGKISSPSLNKIAVALRNTLNISGVKSYSKRV